MSALISILRSAKPLHLRVAAHTAGATIAVVIAMTGYALCFMTGTEKETQWQETVESGRTLIQKQQQITSGRDLAECELFGLTRRLEELNALIPATPESSRFLAQLAELADAYELDIHNFRPGPPEPTENMQRIRVHLSGEGTYECLCRFLNGLQSLPRLTHVAQLQIGTPVTDNLYPVHMELAIFFASDNSTLTKVARHDF